MNTRQALQLSIVQTPDALAKAIETQRQQLEDQLGILRRALDASDFKQASIAAGHVSTVTLALHENLELQMKSRATVFEAATASLVAELSRRALKENDAEAQKALKIPVAKKAGGARVQR